MPKNVYTLKLSVYTLCTCRELGGRYTIGLPWRVDVPVLPNSRAMVMT